MNNKKVDFSIDADDLKKIIRRVFVDPEIELKDWGIDPIEGGLEISSNIYRLYGTAISEKNSNHGQ